MPGRNGTGPMGKGPMTGRGMGFCRNGKSNIGLGMGFGFRRGFRRCFDYDINNVEPKTEKSLLEMHKTMLEAQLENIKNRLDSIADEK